MDRVALTENYLAELETAGLSSEELLGALPQNKILNSDKPNGVGLWLARPVFLGGEELGRLSGGDLDNLLSALDSLPEKLFGGGDFAAFARAVGLTEPQVEAVMQNRGRADDPAEPRRPGLRRDRLQAPRTQHRQRDRRRGQRRRLP